MQQRLGLGVALLGNPALVILDEPTSALDPVGRHDVREIIRGLRERGASVFLNTHLLEEAEHVCDRVAVIDKGTAVATGSLDELLGRHSRVRLKVGGLGGNWWSGLGRFGRWHQQDDWIVVEGIDPSDIAGSRRRAGRTRRTGPRRDPRAPEPRSPLPRAAGRAMNPTLTIAALTIKEAVRRRLLLAFVAISVVIVGLSAWGFDRLSHTRSLTSGETNLAVPEALILFMFMFSFVLALSASAIASPAISSEVESGVLMTIVTRPIRRTEVLIGKWLGLATLLAGYATGVCALEFGVVRLASGFVPPNPVLVTVYLFAEGALLLTLALLLSTRIPVIAAGVIGVAVFGAGWLAGVVGSLGAALNIAALRTVGQVGRFLLPTDGLWHAAIYYLQPPSLIGQHLADGRAAGSVLCPGSTVLGIPAVGRLLVPHRPERRGGELRASRAVKIGTGREHPRPPRSREHRKQDLPTKPPPPARCKPRASELSETMFVERSAASATSRAPRRTRPQGVRWRSQTDRLVRRWPAFRAFGDYAAAGDKLIG